MKIVDSKIVGELWPQGQPGKTAGQCGFVTLEPKGAFEVRSFQTFTLTYTVGGYGIDDTGSIRVLFRLVEDWGKLQTTDPMADNYVTAYTSNGVGLNVEYNPFAQSARPRQKSLTVRVVGGYLSPGNTITIVFGDTSKGSRGWCMQTFAESDMEFKVAADVCAVGHYIPLTSTPTIAIVPGPPKIWHAILPSLRRVGEQFRFGIKAEDAWGNPSPLTQGVFHFETTLPVNGLPTTLTYPLGEKSLDLDGLTVSETGVLRIRIVDDSGHCVAESNPLVIKNSSYAGYWGDLHGQSGESIGINTAWEYFDFARNKAFLDVCSHQANDFQITNQFWEYLNKLTAQFHEDNLFVTFPGYEWSGNTCVGGDRNVYFRQEGRQIRRASHALISDRSDIDTDASNANELFQALAGEDCVIYAHVGGRYADISNGHDPRIETAMEIHSAWGTFEWLLTDGFKLGHRCGVVCNSDGHKGRPGASYPGSSTFGAYGGLTCFLSEELTRDGIFEALRRRHHYGTTGCRMHLDVKAGFPSNGRLYVRDPNAFDDATYIDVKEVMMGDIAETIDNTISLTIEVESLSPIECIDIRNGVENVKKVTGYSDDDLGARIRVIWSGAEYRGRGRETSWEGIARFENAEIRLMQKINAWNPERLFEQVGNNSVKWAAVTTGNFGGFDVWLNEGSNGRLEIDTNHGSLNLNLDEIGVNPIALNAGGLERHLTVYRLPEKLRKRDISVTVKIPLHAEGDNPIWVRVTTEDGHQAWSSPIFLVRK